METFIFSLLYFFLLVSYTLGYMLITDMKFTKKIICIEIIGYFIGDLIYTLLKPTIPDSYYSLFCILIILIFAFNITEKKKIIDLIITLLFVTVIEEGLESLLELSYIGLIKMDELKFGNFFLYASFFLMIFMIVIRQVKKQRSKNRNSKGKMNFLIIVGQIILLLSLVLIIGGIRYAQPYVPTERFFYSSSVLIILAYFGIAFLGMSVIFTRKSNENFRYTLEIEKQMRIQQKINYESILDREYETRKFRHDFQNHLVYILMSLEEENVEATKNYIKEIDFALKESIEKVYSTGNKTIDAIINFYFKDVDDKEICIEILGTATEKLKITEVDLCVIVSNAVKNAMEAVKKQNENNKKIAINMQLTQDDFMMKIWNTCDISRLKERKGVFYTSKEDKFNHGFGIKNMQEIINKNEGKIFWKIEEQGFSCSFSVPLKDNIER